MLELDQDGHLQNFQDWTPEVAQQLADTLELTLDASHFEILYALL
jgi:tRNA 2-thiouridine synthesizing protein E